MPVVTIDFETYYSTEYSLRRMSEVDYILDPRFQTIMCTVKEGDGATDAFVGHDAVASRFAKVDWARAFMIAHNMRFDGAIALWHFGVRPKMYGCTMSMAKAITHAIIGRSSLEKVSEYLGLPAKGKEIVMALGKRLENFSAAELASYIGYCIRDTDNCKGIFNRFLPVFPRSELTLIDTVMRMFIEPKVYLDTAVLAQHLHDVQVRKAAIMDRVSYIDKAVFSSNVKFAALLDSHGIEAPMKISPATGMPTLALAKNDREFKELCQDDTLPLEVQAILAARINSKSTLEETRTTTLLNLSRREWSDGVTGWAPVPIKYYGAHTGRVSGDGGFNWLNFARGSRIREAVIAPPGYRVVHRDASQIECRMVAYLADCRKLIQAFAEGRDVYSEFASRVYGRLVTKADKGGRFVGKTSILGLGYGMGPPRFRHTLFIGNGGMSLSIDEPEARRIVYLYRGEYPEIPLLWKQAETAIDRMIMLSRGIDGTDSRRQRDLMLGMQQTQSFPCVDVGPEAIWMPNGMCIAYPDVRRDRDPSGQGHELSYADPYGGRKHLFGGKVTENIDQGLSRIVITDIIARVAHDTGYHPFLSTYDSVDYAVPEAEARDFDARLEYEFTIRPAWAPGLPLASEGGWGVTMAQAEQGVNL